MIAKIINRFRYKKIQTFTYFIPAPPTRKTGYREKSFDQLIEQLTNLGFRILDINTSSINTESSAGIWAIVKTQTTNKASFDLKVVDFPKEELRQSSPQAASVIRSQDSGIELVETNVNFGEIYQID